MPQYTIGRLKSGFCIYWYEKDGRRRRYRLSARTYQEAQGEARSLITQLRAMSAGPTLEELWEAYCEDRKGRRIAEHMAQTGKNILPVFGKFRPEQITTQDCRNYIALRRDLGRSDHTIHTELGHLRICLSWGAKTRLISWAPPIERPQAPPPRDRYLTHAEIERLLAVDCMPHLRLAILLMLTTAGRVSAILDLTWDRVDFERGKVDLRLSASGPRKGRAVVPMNATLRAALMEARPAAMTRHVVEWGGRRVISIKRGFASVVKAAGLSDDVTPHVLRHTAAVHMAVAGVGMERIAQYLGHSSVQTTRMVYARFAPDHLLDAAAALEFGNGARIQQTSGQSPGGAVSP